MQKLPFWKKILWTHWSKPMYTWLNKEIAGIFANGLFPTTGQERWWLIECSSNMQHFKKVIFLIF